MGFVSATAAIFQSESMRIFAERLSDQESTSATDIDLLFSPPTKAEVFPHLINKIMGFVFYYYTWLRDLSMRFFLTKYLGEGKGDDDTYLSILVLLLVDREERAPFRKTIRETIIRNGHLTKQIKKKELLYKLYCTEEVYHLLKIHFFCFAVCFITALSSSFSLLN